MIVYRICNSTYAKDLNGTGARLYGGRWNSVGVSILYTASTKALAILEALVHTTQDYFPKKLVVISIEIPDNSTKHVIKYSEIEQEIKEFGIAAKFNKIGDNWIKNNESLLLFVPSIIVPDEQNILINPWNKEFNKIKIVDEKSFDFDRRLVK